VHLECATSPQPPFTVDPVLGFLCWLFRQSSTCTQRYPSPPVMSRNPYMNSRDYIRIDSRDPLIYMQLLPVVSRNIFLHLQR